MWVVKTRLQLQVGSAPAVSGGVRYEGIRDTFRKIYHQEGFFAFYRGLSASYLGVIETTLQFVLYGEAKRRIIEGRLEQMQTEVILDDAERRRHVYDDGTAFWTSAGTKLVAAVATYPHEVLRTRMREGGVGEGFGVPRYSGLFQAVSLILREEGVRGLYGGMGVHLLRTVPNAAILLLIVEKITGGEV